MRISDWSSDVCSSDLTAADVASFVEANSGRTNIFYTVGTVRDGVIKKPSKSDIVSTQHLHADIDPPKEQPPAEPEQWIADTLARIAECPTVPPPSYLARPGDGLHLPCKLAAQFYIGGAHAHIMPSQTSTRGLLPPPHTTQATI